MKIKISPSLLLLLASSVLSEHPELTFIAFSAAAIHESGHILAAKILRIKIKSIRLSILGASIETNFIDLSYKNEAILCICGPLSNIVSAFTMYFCFGATNQNILFFITVSLILAFLNLLPVKGFDGGRILFALIQHFSTINILNKVLEISSFICIFTLWSISVYFILKTGAYLSLFIFSGSLFAKMFLIEEKNNI